MGSPTPSHSQLLVLSIFSKSLGTSRMEEKVTHGIFPSPALSKLYVSSSDCFVLHTHQWHEHKHLRLAYWKVPPSFQNRFGKLPLGRGGWRRNQGEVYASLKVSSIKMHSGSPKLLLQISSQPFPSCADLLESAVILGRVPQGRKITSPSQHTHTLPPSPSDCRNADEMTPSNILQGQERKVREQLRGFFFLF